ncbi:MAG: glycosyltransferase [Candidatus Paceibacterota bacterium]
MNVLFVTHYSSLYGANKSLLALLENADKYGIEPFVICPQEGDFVGELKKRNIPYRIFPFKNWMAKSRNKALFRLLWNLLILPYLIYRVKKWDIKHIHTNSSITPIGAWMAYLGNLPHTWHIREFGWEDYELKHDFGRYFFEFWLNKARFVISISESIKKKVLYNIKSPIKIIYNGVISKENIKTIKTSIPFEKSSEPKFGIIGLLSPIKGQNIAIKAFARVMKEYPNCFLYIAGDGTTHYRSYLEKLCLNLGVENRVKFSGYVQDPFSFFESIDVALVCSKNEAMGRVTAEAMIANKIVIGINNAGTSELIEHGETGLLFNGSVNDLSQKMIFTMNNNLYDMHRRANKKAIEDFNHEKYADEIFSILLSKESMSSN